MNIHTLSELVVELCPLVRDTLAVLFIGTLGLLLRRCTVQDISSELSGIWTEEN